MRLFLRGLLLISICFTSCKKDVEQESVEVTNEVVEIKDLTNSSDIEELLEELDSATTAFHNPSKIVQFYKDRNFVPFWNKQELREDLYNNIENVEYEGLFYEDYHGEQIRTLLSKLNSNSETDHLNTEILLTDSFISLANDLGKGKLDPTKIYDIWGTPTNKVEPLELLRNISKGFDLNKVLDSLKPKHIVYLGLKNSLKEYRDKGFIENSSTSIASGKMIRPGEKDERIKNITNRLFELGYYKNNPDSVNEVYSEKIEAALKDFQQDHGLQVDGFIGNTTIENLNLTREDRYHQLLVNLERWRWYPRDLGNHYVIINIPDYELNVVQENDTIQHHKTMVGTEARKTPVFSDKIDYIIYNPTWTIPPTIMKNDVIPGAAGDNNYLSRKGIKVYDHSGNEVDPSVINWNSSKARSYIYRQPAGPTNPLGVVKIIYPNEYMIYLHDTPSKSLFTNNARAQSSGCVRVENVLNLTEHLLSDQEKYDSEKISEILESGETTQIPVTQNVNVHHFYWTAYQNEDTTRFIDDIYDLDKKLWELLKA